MAGYIGIGSAEDLAYVAAHVWSAGVVAALVAMAWDGSVPTLWSARPIHLNAPAWPPLILLALLSVGTAGRHLRTQPRWLWLPAVAVQRSNKAVHRAARVLHDSLLLRPCACLRVALIPSI